MKSSRRGFFATLAALPAVVPGRRATAAAGAPDWYPRNSHGDARTITLTIDGTVGNADNIFRSLDRAIAEHGRLRQRS